MSVALAPLIAPALGAVVGMLSKPEDPKIPEQTVPEQITAGPRPTSTGDKTAGGTLLTGTGGVTGAAPTAKKTLLGQ